MSVFIMHKCVRCGCGGQVESAMAMRSLQPQIKAVQQLYAGDQVYLTSLFSCKNRAMGTIYQSLLLVSFR
jgi:hypothetical protein